MEEFESSIERLRDVFDKAQLLDKLAVKTVLIVLDEDKHKENFIFDLVKLLSERLETSFIFLLAVRGYLAQAKTAHISLETLPQLLAKIKKKFEEQEDLLDIAFITDEEVPPYQRIEEILRKRQIDLIIIPVPYAKFAKEETETTESLGVTIDQLIEKSLTEYKIPLFLVRTIEHYKLPFTKINLLFRGSTIRRDILGWLLTLTTEDASIDIYNTELDSRDLERVSLYYQVLANWIKKENKLLTITHKIPSISLKDFCDQKSTEPGTLVLFQGLEGPAEDFRQVICVLCRQQSNILLFPPE